MEFINIKEIAKKTINLLYFFCIFCIFLQKVVVNIDNLIINIRFLEILNNLLL